MTKVTRIKYEEKDGKFLSHKEFLGNDGILLQVEIDPATSTVCVMQVAGEVYSVVESSSYPTFTKAKTLAKEMLKKYGVSFLDEARAKRVTKVVKTATGTEV